MEPSSSEPQGPQSVSSKSPLSRPLAPSAPWWLWSLTLGGFGAIFWYFLPEPSTMVLYSPWFLDQIEAGSIESLSVNGIEIQGVLRSDQVSSSQIDGPRGRRFVTYFPSEHSIEPVIRRLRERDRAVPPVHIQTSPRREGGLLHLVLLIQSVSLIAVALVLVKSLQRASA